MWVKLQILVIHTRARDNHTSERLRSCGLRHAVKVLMWPSGPVNIQMDPPQIATEGFSSDLLSEKSPEQHIKNVEKSRRANIIFFGIIQNGR